MKSHEHRPILPASNAWKCHLNILYALTVKDKNCETYMLNLKKSYMRALPLGLKLMMAQDWYFAEHEYVLISHE